MKTQKLTIAYGSDLHLGPRDKERRLKALAFPKEADVIILAGDIGSGTWALIEVMELADQFPSAHVVWVAGNHEFYNVNIDEQIQHYRDACASHDRVHFLENNSIEISGVTFLGCTLWSDFSILGETKLAMEVAERGVYDFECIETRKGERFTPRDAVNRFNDSCGYLRQQLANCDPDRTVVVTHFPPGLATRNLLFPADAITGYFQANIDHLIDRYQPSLWIYGHNHYGNDFYRGSTRLVSSQLGYPSEEGYIPAYDPSKLIVLEGGLGPAITDLSLLGQASRLINSQGDPCDFGCTEADIDRMIAHAKEKYPEKPYRVVTGWCWGDLELSPGQIGIFHKHGVKPSFIYADKVIQDERAPDDTVLSVKTSLLVEFHRECIFTTRNTNYILVGPGSRMTVHPSVFTSIFF